MGRTRWAGPSGTVQPDPAHNARIDWVGHRGVLPCADCAGIETVVILADDGTYSTHSHYRGKNDPLGAGTLHME
ncbi:MAG: copper resistance protein NlpE N-terminal domain-containing protein [Steroidobacteraceae bacterium]